MPVAVVDLFDALGLSDSDAQEGSGATESKQPISDLQMGYPWTPVGEHVEAGGSYLTEDFSGSLVLPEIVPGSASMADLDAYLWAVPPMPSFGADEIEVPPPPFGFVGDMHSYAFPWSHEPSMFHAMDYYIGEADGSIVGQESDLMGLSPLLADYSSCSNDFIAPPPGLVEDDGQPISLSDSLESVFSSADKGAVPGTPSPRRSSSLGDAVKVTPTSNVSNGQPSFPLTPEEEMTPSKVPVPFQPTAPIRVLKLSDFLAAENEAKQNLNSDIEVSSSSSSVQEKTPSPGDALEGHEPAASGVYAAVEGAAFAQRPQGGHDTPSTSASDSGETAFTVAKLSGGPSVGARQRVRRRRSGAETKESSPSAGGAGEPSSVRLGRRAKNGERRTPLPLAERR